MKDGYNALGEKLFSVVNDGLPAQIKLEYAGPFTFKNGALGSVSITEGRLNGTGTDHLGSVRATTEGSSSGAATPTSSVSGQTVSASFRDEPGRYTLSCTVRDKVSQEEIKTYTWDFSIVGSMP